MSHHLMQFVHKLAGVFDITKDRPVARQTNAMHLDLSLPHPAVAYLLPVPVCRFQACGACILSMAALMEGQAESLGTREAITIQSGSTS